nr:winged helix-turn-helix transcriptional regulator [Bacillus licheniformis]
MEMRDDKRLLIKVCKMYYEEDMTQSQIAKATGIYRTTVGRMLKKAREAGIVKITIDDHVGTHYDLERELERVCSGLKKCTYVMQNRNKQLKTRRNSSAKPEPKS